MSEFSDEEVRKFMEQYYPKYKDNLVLGRLLYARHLGRILPAQEDDYVMIKVKDIGEKYEGKNVKTRAVIATVERYEFLACPKCNKKNCNCGVRDEEKLRRVRLSGIFGDEEECANYIYFSGLDDDEFEVGKEYILYGIVKKRLDNEGNIVYLKGKPVYEMLVRRFEIAEAEEMNDGDVKKVLDFVRKAKKVKVEIVKNMCRKLGVKYERLCLKEVDGYVVWEE